MDRQNQIKRPLSSPEGLDWLQRELPHTQIVSVMDREAAFFELFVAQRDHPRVHLLVRALHNRRLDAQYTLCAKVRQSPFQGSASIGVGRQSARLKSSKLQVVDKRLARTAEVELRYLPVELVSSSAEHKHTARTSCETARICGQRLRPWGCRLTHKRRLIHPDRSRQSRRACLLDLLQSRPTAAAPQQWA